MFLQKIDIAIVKLSFTTRIWVAFSLGLIIVAINRYTTNHTLSDSAYSELAHNAADCITLFTILLLTGERQSFIQQTVRLLGGLLLCVAGVTSLIKGYTTFVLIFMGAPITLRNGNLFIVASSVTVILVAVQLLLTKKEHSLFHGNHTHMTGEVLYVELWSDLIHAFSVVCVSVLAVSLPNEPILVRFIDLGTTICLGVWMVLRGIQIIAQKKPNSCKYTMVRFPKG